ncbi:MAG TPA: ABC transporter permease [Streptosporangiaceae bacterium]
MTVPGATAGRASRAAGLYLARRVAGTVLLLAVMSVLIFSLLYAEPGDIVRNLLGTRPVNPQTMAQIRAEYHLNEPFVQQYWTWLSGAFTGNFGTSVQSGQPVAAAITSRLGLTLELVVLAFVLAVVTAIPAGVLAGVRHGRGTDRAVVGGAVLFVSAPAFALGLLMLYLFADYLNWFPVYGTGSGVTGRFDHLLLPAATLALGLGGFILKITRAAVIRELDQDYVMFARARGLRNRRVLTIVLRNASVPVMTSLGLALAYLVGSTVLVEQVFSLPGLGTLLDNAVIFKDVPVVQALTLLMAAAIALSALLVDLAYLALDPRIRYEMTAR